MQTSAALLLHAECCCVERHAWLQRTGRGRAIEYDISPVEAQAHLCCVSMGLEETAPTGARTCPSLACSVEHMQSTSWAMATLTNLIQSEGVAVFQCLHQHGGSKLLHSATLPRPQVYLSFQDIWLQLVLSAGTLPQMACITLKHGASSWQTSLIRSLASQPSFCATQLEVSLHAAAACATTADLTGKKPLPWTWSSLEGAPFCEGCSRPPMQSPSRHEVEPPLQASPRCRQPRSSPGWCGACSCRMCRCACCTAASRIASSAHWSKRCRTLCGRPAWVRCSSSRLHQPRCGPLSVSHS